MSTSSLFLIDDNFNGEAEFEYSNGWLFFPVVWDVLFEKYCPELIISRFGMKQNFMSAAMFDNTVQQKLNMRINESNSLADRVCWELSNQQVFFAKDKDVVAKSINDFWIENPQGDYGEHILERFAEISSDIENISIENTTCFVFKGTSVDDAVECWFSRYNEDDDDYESQSLDKIDEHAFEFVFFKDGLIEGFEGNVDYFKNKN